LDRLKILGWTFLAVQKIVAIAVYHQGPGLGRSIFLMVSEMQKLNSWFVGAALVITI
jgi:hypothetical protein